jgi:dihydroflavonol-4-reductase
MILLLGATGLLGHNVLRLLLERREPVRVLIRPGSGLLPLDTWTPAEPAGDGSVDIRDNENLEIVVGDPLDYNTLLNAAKGCLGIINCVGTTDMSLSDVQDFNPANTNLPAQLGPVMQVSGASRLVHVSTANTIQPGSKACPSDESFPFGEPFSSAPYAVTKKAGEDQLLSFAQYYPDLKFVIVNPGFMIGPYDAKPSSGKLLLAAYGRKRMYVPDGGKTFVHVRDVAKAVIHALEFGGSGRYLLTGESLTLQEFYTLQAEVCGYRQRISIRPDGIVRLGGRAGDLLRSFGIRTMLCSRNVNQLIVEDWYDCSRAERELAFTHTPVADAIRDFFAWREANEKK